MNSDTSPSAQTPPGISRQRNRERGESGIGLLKRVDYALFRPHPEEPRDARRLEG